MNHQAFFLNFHCHVVLRLEKQLDDLENQSKTLVVLASDEGESRSLEHFWLQLVCWRDSFFSILSWRFEIDFKTSSDRFVPRTSGIALQEELDDATDRRKRAHDSKGWFKALTVSHPDVAPSESWSQKWQDWVHGGSRAEMARQSCKRQMVFFCDFTSLKNWFPIF